MDAHHIPEPIQWHEGLLLTPQHFQQMSLRHEALLQYLSASLTPFLWGVRHTPVRVDASSLSDGTLRISDLEAVMPDGLVVSLGAGRGQELSVDLKPYGEHMKERPVTVHLAVAARQTDAITRGDLPRFDSVDGDPIADETTGEGQLRIPRLRPRLTLVVTDTPPRKADATPGQTADAPGKQPLPDAPAKHYVSFPLVRVIYNNESYALTDFIPPTLSVTPQSPLGRMCAPVAARLRDTAKSLSEQLTGQTVIGQSRRAGETEHLIQSLVTPLPQLEAVLRTGVSHPYLVYLALCATAGHICAMGRALIPPQFAPYDHDDLRATFRQALDFINRTIDVNVVSTYKLYPFSYEGGVFSRRFEREWAGRRLALGLRSQPGVSVEETKAWGRECVIGSESRMGTLRAKRVLGAAREWLERDELFVPPRDGVLFELRPDRDSVVPGDVLQIRNAGERDRMSRPAEIVLYVANEK
jgi:type VI secretion system protein ImpJ